MQRLPLLPATVFHHQCCDHDIDSNIPNLLRNRSNHLRYTQTPSPPPTPENNLVYIFMTTSVFLSSDSTTTHIPIHIIIHIDHK